MNTARMSYTFTLLAALAMRVSAVPPTMNVTWEEAPPPEEGQDYLVDLTNPDFPNVELIEGSLTWRIWSVDPDNPGGIGDIGDITAFGAEDYGLSIADGAGGPGARQVKGIELHPSIASNYSKLTGGRISGNLAGDLFLQESTGGEGGSASFTIGGNLLGEAVIPHGAGFTIEGDIGGFPPYGPYGTVRIGDIRDGAFTVERDLRYGAITVDDHICNADLPSNSIVDMSHSFLTGGATLDFGTHDVHGQVLIESCNGHMHSC